MLQGLKELKTKLKNEDFNFYLIDYNKLEDIKQITKKASLLISEKAYLKHLRKWKNQVAAKVKIPFYLVESNLICPIEEVSDKEEYAAYTIT